MSSRTAWACGCWSGTRAVRLTESGSRYLADARRILSEVEEAEAAVQAQRSEPRGRLVVAAPVLFGRMRVAPIVSRLLETHPLLTAELRLSDRNSALLEDGVDVAVRIGRLTDSDFVARRLGETRRVLVASPDYVRARGDPASPAALKAHDLIAFDPLVHGDQWAFEAVPARVRVEPRLSTNSADVAISHALRRGGITAAFCYQVADDIAAGRLVEVLPGTTGPAMPIHAIYPSSRHVSAKLRVFLDAAQAAAANWPSPAPPAAHRLGT